MTCLSQSRPSSDPFELQAQGDRVRQLVVESLAKVGIGHLGGCLSCVDILTTLYFNVMNIDPANPRWSGRDRFVLSKGHAGPALYAVLALRGFFDPEMLNTINAGGTYLPSHADMNRTPGVDMTAGSLGQGISCAVGMAYAARLDGMSHRVYTLVGDGECQEGEVWEAAMAASAKGLDNLTVIVDDNKLQIDGFTSEIMPVGPLGAKWTAFGFHVIEVDGHDPAALTAAFHAAVNHRGAPSCIIAHTIKCLGVSSAENQPTCHNMPVSDSHVDEMVRWIANRTENRERSGGHVHP